MSKPEPILPTTYGPSFDPEFDGKRLHHQFNDILFLMQEATKTSSTWLTLAEIEAETGYPQSSISAQLRHMRKAQFGGHIVEKRRRVIIEEGKPTGTWEYRVTGKSEAQPAAQVPVEQPKSLKPISPTTFAREMKALNRLFDAGEIEPEHFDEAKALLHKRLALYGRQWWLDKRKLETSP